jgi:hypothetical protein
LGSAGLFVCVDGARVGLRRQPGERPLFPVEFVKSGMEILTLGEYRCGGATGKNFDP